MDLHPHPDSLWIPGAGLVPADVRIAVQAIEDYDPNLSLGKSHIDGTWVVLWNRGPEGRPFPVYNLGRELPGRERIQQLLYERDVVRHGGKLVEQLQRRVDDRQKALDKEAHERAEEAADDINTAFHVAKRHGAPRIFVPKDIPKPKE